MRTYRKKKTIFNNHVFEMNKYVSAYLLVLTGGEPHSNIIGLLLDGTGAVFLDLTGVVVILPPLMTRASMSTDILVEVTDHGYIPLKR